MDDEDLRETTLERRIVHRGRYVTFRVDTIVDPTGKRHRREVVEHPGAVVVLPLDRGDLLMVRQFRTPVGRVLLELPAGTLDRTEDGEVEAPDVAAARELGEETGHRARRWRPLGRFYSAPGFTDELMHLYLATDLEPIEGYRGPDTDEHLRLERIPWREAVSMADRGAIEDAKTLVGLLWLARLAGDGEPPLGQPAAGEPAAG